MMTVHANSIVEVESFLAGFFREDCLRMSVGALVSIIQQGYDIIVTDTVNDNPSTDSREE